MDEASRFGIMNVDEHDQIYEFEEKPAHPKSNLASMGVYIFTWEKLREYLIADEADPDIQQRLRQEHHPRHAGRRARRWPPTASRATGRTWAPSTPCGTPTWICSPPTSGINLYDTSWPIYARSAILPPQFIGDERQVLTHCHGHRCGCEVYGTVENSVLFHSVTVEPGAIVRYSILMPGTVVKAGATVEYAIVAREHQSVGCDARGGRPARTALTTGALP